MVTKPLPAKTWPTYGGRFDRTILREYGLPRQMTRDEIDEIIDARGRSGLHRLRITARDYPAVAAQLAVRDGELDDVAGQKILSCGEGASNFSQTLESRGAVCVALDRLYLTPRQEMAERHLIAQSTNNDYAATLFTPDEAFARLPKRIVGGDLRQLPFADGTFDKVFAPHVLYWYLDKDYSTTLGVSQARLASHGMAIIAEGVRAAAEGGYFQFNLAGAKHCAQLAKTLRKTYPVVEQRSDWVLRIHR